MACAQRFAVRRAAAVYNSLLEICARTRDMVRGEEVIGRMARAGVLPDEDTAEVHAPARPLLFVCPCHFPFSLITESQK